MTTLDKCELWEEILFGDTHQYRRILDAFPDTATHLATTNVDPPAKEVVRAIVDGSAPGTFRSRSMVVELIDAAIDDNRRSNIGYGFPEYLRDELYDLLDPIPEHLLEEIAEDLPDDLPEPKAKYPVQWPEN